MNKKKNKKDFKTPKGYFEGFTDRLLDKMSSMEGNQEESILPEKEGFKLPDGYFDSLNKNIQEKLNDEVPKVIALNRRRKFYYYVAAAVAAIVLLTVGIQTNMNQEPTFENLAKTEIEDYFNNTDLGLSTYEIAEVIPVDELEISDITDNQIEDENIIDYLDNSIDNIEELNLTDYEY
jgi:hypothetical protein